MVPAQCYENKEGKHCQVALDTELDSSGWTSGALKVMSQRSASLSYEKAHEVIALFEVLPYSSRAGLERLTQPYAAACQQELRECLEIAQSAELATGQSRKMIIEVDGVRVLGQPEAGECPGIELKTAVIYPMASPYERRFLADDAQASYFTEQVAGLMREAQLRQDDELIGLSEGAEWIKNLFDSLGIEQIIDVYHASSYLDTVMQALSWDDTRREETRRSLLRGEINISQWLQTHLSEPEQWLSWDDETLTALRYLEERQQQMDYPSYKARGLAIGSGQVEGMNKSVIGFRMKQSGMHWSRSGAGRMASLRANSCSKQPLLSHHTIRHTAFPCPLT